MLSNEEKAVLKTAKENYGLTSAEQKILVNLIEKQQKEIEEAEQKEKKAYIKGTNDADELCNKKWEDKIKAKIEPVLKQLDTKMKEEYNKYGNSREYQDIVDAYNFLQSLLEKE